MRCGILSFMLPKQSLETFRNGAGVRQLTFPHSEDSPAKPTQLSQFLLVTSHRAIDLVAPKFGSCVRIISVPAVCVVMPKAPVNEDNGSETWERYVRFARKAADVDPEPEAQSVQ